MSRNKGTKLGPEPKACICNICKIKLVRGSLLLVGSCGHQIGRCPPKSVPFWAKNTVFFLPPCPQKTTAAATSKPL